MKNIFINWKGFLSLVAAVGLRHTEHTKGILCCLLSVLILGPLFQVTDKVGDRVGRNFDVKVTSSWLGTSVTLWSLQRAKAVLLAYPVGHKL